MWSLDCGGPPRSTPITVRVARSMLVMHDETRQNLNATDNYTREVRCWVYCVCRVNRLPVRGRAQIGHLDCRVYLSLLEAKCQVTPHLLQRGVALKRGGHRVYWGPSKAAGCCNRRRRAGFERAKRRMCDCNRPIKEFWRTPAPHSCTACVRIPVRDTVHFPLHSSCSFRLNQGLGRRVCTMLTLT